MDIRNINVIVLAYLGDTIYEDYIREYLIKTGINNVNDLQKESVKYVCATAQSKFLDHLVEINFFTEEELDVIKRARNHKCNSHPKCCDIITYKKATGFEALFGYLKLNNNIDRIREIIKEIGVLC